MSNPYVAGKASGTGSGSSITISLTTNVADSDSVIVGAFSGGAATVTGVTDSQGQAYLPQASNNASSSCQVWTYECVGSVPLVAGTDTITVNYSLSGSDQAAIAVGVPNIAQADKTANASGTGTTASVATGTLSQAEETVIAFISDLTAGGVPTLGGGLTVLDHQAGGNSTGIITAGYNNVASTASTTPSGTITSTTWAIAVVTQEVNPVTFFQQVPPNGVTGVPYSFALGASGGVTPYTYALTSGSLPTGLSLSAGGVISGTPTVAGSYSFTVTATDTNGVSGSVSATVLITAMTPVGNVPRPSNLLSAADADLEAGSPTWAALTNASSVAATSSIAATGTKSLMWTAPAAGNSSVTTGFYPATAGKPYLASGLLFATRATDSYIAIAWYNGASLLSTSTSQDWIQQGLGTWQPVSLAAVAPAGTTQCKVQLIVNAQASDTQFADFLDLRQSDTQVLIDWVFPAFAPSSAAGNDFLDVTAWVRLDAGITMTHGRQDAISEIQPGSGSFQLQNDTGYFTQNAVNNLPSVLGGSIDLQYRCQINLADQNGAWWTRFDGPITQLDYTIDSTGNTNVCAVTLADVMSMMSRQDTLKSWTREQVLADGPTYHWALDDGANTGVAGIGAETSGNNGPPMRPYNSDVTNPVAATITWQSTSGGVETLADAAKPLSPDGRLSWAPGTNQPNTPLRGLNSGAVGPFTSPSPCVYTVAKTVVDSTSFNSFESNLGYSLSAQIPVISTSTTGQDFSAELFFSCDGQIRSNVSNKVGPWIQLTLANSKTQRNVCAGVFLTGSGGFTYNVEMFDQPPSFKRQNFPGVPTGSPTSTISTSFTPDSAGQPRPHHLVLNVQADPVAPVLTAYIDGTQVGQLTLHQGQNFDTVIIGAASGGSGCHSGGLQLCSIYPFQLSLQQVTQHCMLGQYGMWEQTTDDCIATLGQLSGIPAFWNNLQAQHNGLTMTEYQDIAGNNALTSMQLYEQAENGLLFINAAGQLTFQTRDYRMGKGAPDISLPPDAYSAELGLNLVTTQQANEEAIATQLFTTGTAYVNSASRNQYGTFATAPVGSPVQLPLITWSRAFAQINMPAFYYWSDPNLDDLSAWIANTRSAPWQFPSSLTFDLLTLDPTWGLHLSDFYGIDISTLVAPSSVPASLPTQNLSLEWFVEGVTETKSTSVHTIQVFCSPAEAQRAWKPGDATYGALGTTTRVGISQADLSTPQADGKDVSHDAGRPYWPPSFASTMNNPSGSGAGFVGAADLRGLTDNLNLLLQPPMCVVSATGQTQSQPSGSNGGPQIFWDTVHTDTVGGMGAIPGWPNWYVCLVPGFYDIDGCVCGSSLGTAGDYWQGWIVVAMQAAQALAAGSGTPLTVGTYVCPIGETKRINSVSMNENANPSTRMYLGLGDMVTLAAETTAALSTGTGNGGSHMSIVFRGLGTADDRCQLNSSIANGGTVTTPSGGNPVTKTYSNTHTYSYWGNEVGGKRRNSDSAVFQSCAKGYYKTSGSQKAQIVFNHSQIASDLAGKTIVTATLTLTNQGSWYTSGVRLRLGVFYDAPGGSKWNPKTSANAKQNMIQQHFSNGQVLKFPIPASMVGEIVNNGANGFVTGMLGDSDLNDYGWWRGGVATSTLQVTYE